LKAEEQPFARPLLGGQAEQILSFKQHGSSGYLVGRVPGEDLGEGAFAAAIAPHQGVDFASADGEVDTMKDRLIFDLGMEITDLKQNRGIGSDHGSLRKARGKS